ncbi:MAG: hypothetical protein KME64_02310 [Scytonematopsis contorta HA4267-MV1]|jgi:transposase|nr:hypothetical protein [Scytonematopsis contorta HA4267-MV1]
MPRKPIDVTDLRTLGIDEISLVKGQGKFIVVLVDIEKGKLIGLVKERKKIENKLKLIKRSGFGFRNFCNFEIRALLSWHYSKDLAR